MNRLTKYRKLLKYRALRRLPGARGRHYERKLRKLSVNLRFDSALLDSKAKTCIDLGANVGVYTKKMAVAARQVIAFEPDPCAYSQLVSNVANLNNVRIENAAAGTGEGTVHLYRHSEFESDPVSMSKSSSILSLGKHLNMERAIEVRQIDFIKYLEDLDEDIGVLKIDIEGAEVELLEVMFDRPDILSRIDYVFAETHEWFLADQISRVSALRERSCRMERPIVDLEWF